MRAYVTVLAFLAAVAAWGVWDSCCLPESPPVTEETFCADVPRSCEYLFPTDFERENNT